MLTTTLQSDIEIQDYSCLKLMFKIKEPEEFQELKNADIIETDENLLKDEAEIQ